MPQSLSILLLFLLDFGKPALKSWLECKSVSINITATAFWFRHPSFKLHSQLKDTTTILCLIWCVCSCTADSVSEHWQSSLCPPCLLGQGHSLNLKPSYLVSLDGGQVQEIPSVLSLLRDELEASVACSAPCVGSGLRLRWSCLHSMHFTATSSPQLLPGFSLFDTMLLKLYPHYYPRLCEHRKGRNNPETQSQLLLHQNSWY